MFAKIVMTKIYAKALKPQDVPWHVEQPTKFLVDATKSLPQAARVLDIGSGTGTYAVHLVKQGFDVTGIDYIPKAIAMAKERARDQGATVTWIETDLFA